MKPIFEKICKDFEAELIEFDGKSDHVHLLINYPPKISIFKLLNSLKGVSSRQVRKQNFKSVMEKLGGDSLWSPNYFAGSWWRCTIRNYETIYRTARNTSLIYR